MESPTELPFPRFMASQNPHPSQSPQDEAMKASKKTWKVGTLTYTGAGLAVLFCWLLWGDFSYQMRDRTIPPVMQLLFRKFGASDTLTGLLFSSMPAAIGLIVGPIVGYKSDRLRSRWGRRIPFLVGPIPVIVLAILGLAFSPQLGRFFHQALGGFSPGLNESILLCLGVSWALFEIAQSIANFVFGGLINDVVPQAVIGRFFGLFRTVSLLAAIIFNYTMMGKAETSYVPIFLGIGALYGIGFTLMCLNVKEGEYPPPELSPEKPSTISAIKTYLKDGFGHSFYLWFFATSVFGGLMGVPFTLYGVFYAKSIGMSLDAYGKCYALTYGISLCLAYPISVLVDRFHPVRVTLAASDCTSSWWLGFAISASRTCASSASRWSARWSCWVFFGHLRPPWDNDCCPAPDLRKWDRWEEFSTASHPCSWLPRSERCSTGTTTITTQPLTSAWSSAFWPWLQATFSIAGSWLWRPRTLFAARLVNSAAPASAFSPSLISCSWGRRPGSDTYEAEFSGTNGSSGRERRWLAVSPIAQRKDGRAVGNLRDFGSLLDPRL
jgi:MFS family permease